MSKLTPKCIAFYSTRNNVLNYKSIVETDNKVQYNYDYIKK